MRHPAPARVVQPARSKWPPTEKKRHTIETDILYCRWWQVLHYHLQIFSAWCGIIFTFFFTSIMCKIVDVDYWGDCGVWNTLVRLLEIRRCWGPKPFRVLLPSSNLWLLYTLYLQQAHRFGFGLLIIHLACWWWNIYFIEERSIISTLIVRMCRCSHHPSHPTAIYQ